MSDPTPSAGKIVRGFAIDEGLYAIVVRYAKERCGGNTSLALRTIIAHFDTCPLAADVQPLLPTTQEASA